MRPEGKGGPKNIVTLHTLGIVCNKHVRQIILPVIPLGIVQTEPPGTASFQTANFIDLNMSATASTSYGLNGKADTDGPEQK